MTQLKKFKLNNVLQLIAVSTNHPLVTVQNHSDELALLIIDDRTQTQRLLDLDDVEYRLKPGKERTFSFNGTITAKSGSTKKTVDIAVLRS